jgi:hypothetical protein
MRQGRVTEGRRVVEATLDNQKGAIILLTAARN